MRMEQSAEKLKDERDALNLKVKSFIEKSKDISARIGEIHNKKDTVQDNPALDKIASLLQKNLKKLKDEKKKLAKQISSVSGELKKSNPKAFSDIKKISDEMKKLDWAVQTEVMSGKREDALSRKVIALERQLKESRQYADVINKIDGWKNKIDDIRYQIELHNDVITDVLDKKYKIQSKVFKQVRQLRKEHIKLKKINKTILEIKKDADGKHKELVSILKGKREARDVAFKDIQVKKAEGVRKAKDKEMKDIETAHDTLFDQLKKKKKIVLG